MSPAAGAPALSYITHKRMRNAFVSRQKHIQLIEAAPTQYIYPRIDPSALPDLTPTLTAICITGDLVAAEGKVYIDPCVHTLLME